MILSRRLTLRFRRVHSFLPRAKAGVRGDANDVDSTQDDRIAAACLALREEAGRPMQLHSPPVGEQFREVGGADDAIAARRRDVRGAGALDRA